MLLLSPSILNGPNVPTKNDKIKKRMVQMSKYVSGDGNGNIGVWKTIKSGLTTC